MVKQGAVSPSNFERLRTSKLESAKQFFDKDATISYGSQRSIVEIGNQKTKKASKPQSRERSPTDAK